MNVIADLEDVTAQSADACRWRFVSWNAIIIILLSKVGIWAPKLGSAGEQHPSFDEGNPG